MPGQAVVARRVYADFLAPRIVERVRHHGLWWSHELPVSRALHIGQALASLDGVPGLPRMVVHLLAGDPGPSCSVIVHRLGHGCDLCARDGLS